MYVCIQVQDQLDLQCLTAAKIKTRKFKDTKRYGEWKNTIHIICSHIQYSTYTCSHVHVHVHV